MLIEAPITQSSSYKSSDKDLGDNHLANHADERNWRQYDPADSKDITVLEVYKDSDTLPSKNAKNMLIENGFLDDQAIKDHDAKLPPSRANRAYGDWVGYMTAKSSKIRKGLENNLKLHNEDRVKDASYQLANFHNNDEIPITSTLLYLGNTDIYDHILKNYGAKVLTEFRTAERETFTQYHASHPFQVMHPNVLWAEIDSDEEGAQHLQMSDLQFDKVAFATTKIKRQVIQSTFGTDALTEDGKLNPNYAEEWHEKLSHYETDSGKVISAYYTVKDPETGEKVEKYNGRSETAIVKGMYHDLELEILEAYAVRIMKEHGIDYQRIKGASKGSQRSVKQYKKDKTHENQIKAQEAELHVKNEKLDTKIAENDAKIAKNEAKSAELEKKSQQLDNFTDDLTNSLIDNIKEIEPEAKATKDSKHPISDDEGKAEFKKQPLHDLFSTVCHLIQSWRDKLLKREKEVQDREDQAAAKELKNTEDEQKIIKRENAAALKETQNEQRNNELNERESGLKQRENAAEAKELKNTEDEQSIIKRENTTTLQKTRNEQRDKKLNERESSLNQRDDALDLKSDNIDKKQDALNKLETRVGKKQSVYKIARDRLLAVMGTVNTKLHQDGFDAAVGVQLQRQNPEATRKIRHDLTYGTDDAQPWRATQLQISELKTLRAEQQQEQQEIEQRKAQEAQQARSEYQRLYGDKINGVSDSNEHTKDTGYDYDR
ncbi:hypothetical protein FC26_GL000475 [Paucilactobacillus vaccinostercus DSM 20634]|uniref:Uncharacterized protein n=1 Tax=Paucilactobacillus vaccinostercus DSM 20634 TaxID=1423813 RepID=A0A0R2A1F3_9LACO|nr:hypothetical protein [Paucilactobacillus vaccinostercus]KRM60389.1 hypothetical protein FC26_GL000475 [Paucilactobacillus vaccinostercus DSM 20634]